MKTPASGVVQYASKNDYLSKKPVSKSSTLDTVKSLGDKQVAGPNPDASKVNVSEKAKGLKEKAKSTIDHDKKQLKGAAKRLLGDATDVAKKALKTPGVSNLLKIPGLGKSESTNSVKNVKDSEVPKVVNAPGIFFINGLELLSSSDGDDGLTNMAKHIPRAEHYSWQQEDEIMGEILKRPHNQPIILVGHSLGGDAAVSIANKLNSLENGYRKVSLLVTLDSVGFDNDIIPQNVAKNYNVISNEDVFFNDGPNIARNTELTQVLNELRSEGHTDIDDNNEVQFKIFDAINKVLGEEVARRNAEKVRLKALFADLKI